MRDHGLDAARALAMLLVVATHAALSFMVTPIGWAIQDRSQFLGVDLYVWIVRAFAMPTFFWLAGYFSRASLVANAAGGLAGFARNRAVRIALPLAVAIVPCSLVLGALWDWGREVGNRAVVADNIPKLRGSEIPIVLGHLWFLYYLLWLSAAAVVIRSFGLRAPTGVRVVVVPAVITFGILAALSTIHTDTPLGFVPDLAILAYMGAFFAWGWWVHARPEELARYARWTWRALAFAPVVLAVVIATLYRGLAAVEGAPIYASAASAMFSIAAMIAFLGACVRYVPRPVRLFRLGADASYWTYIVHLPIVVALQIGLAPIAVPWPFKYVAIVAIVMALCLGSYALFGRLRTRSRNMAPQR